MQAIPSNPERIDLWRQAYSSLKCDEPDLVRQYEEIVHSHRRYALGERSGSTPAIRSADEEVAAAILAHTAGQESEELTRFSAASKRLQSCWENLLKMIIYSKDLISSAVAAEPHAALAWVGVSLLLPMLLNHPQQKAEAIEGLSEVTSLIQTYNIKARLYLGNAMEPKVREYMVDLYTLILKYEMLLLRQMNRAPILRYIRDIAKVNNWSALLADIRKLDQRCNAITHQLDIEDTKRSWLEQIKTGKDHLRLAKEGAVLASDKRSAKCLQTFLTTIYEDYKLKIVTREENTCKWIFTHADFQEWRDAAGPSLLWISAGPGCGKSVMAASLLRDTIILGRSCFVCYFFFREDNEDQRSASSALCAVIHQLLRNKKGLLTHALSPYDEFGVKLQKNFTLLWQLFITLCNDHEAGEVVCMFDGLDEAYVESSEILVDAMNAYMDTHNGSSSNLRFLVTSRLYVRLERRLNMTSTSSSRRHIAGEASREANTISEEITRVIRARVPRIAAVLRLEPPVEAKLLERLLAVPNRTYLWLDLIFKHISETLGATDSDSVLELISQIPQDLHETYETILKKSVDPLRARLILQILLAARRPLTLSQAKVFLKIPNKGRINAGAYPRSYGELHLQTDDQFRVTITNTCGHFVTVIDSRVYLIHPSARDFLIASNSRNDTNGSGWKGTFALPDCHASLADCCVSYLQSCLFQYDTASGEYGLSTRCSRNSSERNTRIVDDLVDLTGPEYRHGAVSTRSVAVSTPEDRHSAVSTHSMAVTRRPMTVSTRAALHTSPMPRAATSSTSTRPALHTSPVPRAAPSPASTYWLLDDNSTYGGLDDNADDDKPPPADVLEYVVRYWPVHCGRAGKLPRDSSLHMSIRDALQLCDSTKSVGKLWYSQWARTTPYWHPLNPTNLILASFFGMANVVEVLLQDVSAKAVNGCDEQQVTALGWGAILGHAEVVSILLSSPYIDVNCRTRKGFTPLILASEHGYTEIVENLIRHPDIDLRVQAMGWSPLRMAANNARFSVLELLLDSLGRDGSLSNDCQMILDFNLPWMQDWQHADLRKKIEELAFS